MKGHARSQIILFHFRLQRIVFVTLHIYDEDSLSVLSITINGIHAGATTRMFVIPKVQCSLCSRFTL